MAAVPDVGSHRVLSTVKLPRLSFLEFPLNHIAIDRIQPLGEKQTCVSLIHSDKPIAGSVENHRLTARVPPSDARRFRFRCHCM